MTTASPPLGLAADTRPTSADAPVLTRKMMMGWGLGTLGPVIVLSSCNALLLRFMTDVVGIGAGMAAMLIGLSKLYDAFADPTMGWISDNTRSKAGRRRPYLMGGGVLLALSLVLLFWVPPFESDAMRTLFMGGVLIFYATAYTIFNIPYMAMPAEMASHYHQRTELMSYRVYAVGLAQLFSMFLGTALLDQLGGGADGHFRMALVLAPVVIASAVIVYVATRDAPSTARSEVHSPFREQVRSVVANKPYLILIGVKLLTLTSLSAYSVLPFFFQRILGVSNVYLGTYFAVSSVTLILSQPVWIWVSRKLGKATTFRLALALSVPVFSSWLFASAADPLALIFVRAVAIGFMGGGALLMGQSLLPDTMEYDFLRTGLRREGVFAGFYTTVEKIAAAGGIAIVGALLSAAGYIQSRGVGIEQPESALTAIRLIVALLPAGVSLLAFLLMFAYHLPEDTLRNLRAQHAKSAQA